MTEIVICIEETNESQIMVSIKNLRSDDATQKEKLFCDNADEAILVLMKSLFSKSPELLKHTKWKEDI